MRLARPRVLALVAVVVVLALVALLLVWWTGRPGSRLEEAARMAPADAQRLTWTDWRAVRAEVGTSDLDELLSRGFDADLSSTSALTSSAEAMRSSLGVSPATLEWELLSQGPQGAAVFLRLPDSTDVSEVGPRLKSLGYAAPGGSGDVWSGGVDVASQAGFTPELQYVALLADEHLLVASDDARYAQTTVDTVRGDSSRVEGLDPLVEAAAGASSAVVFSGDYVCEKLAMAQADPDAAAEGEALIEAAGGVHPLRGFALAVRSDRRAEALFLFERDDQADEDARSRSTLAAGPAPGQGGEFSERFTVSSASSDGPMARLDLRVRDGAFVMSDLTSGPVLFASC